MSPITSHHSWDLSPAEAIQLQQQLREQVQLKPLEKTPKWIAGTDLSYNKGSDEFYAAVIVLDYETMEVVAHSSVIRRAPFPYIPGLLSFREMPSLLEAWEGLPIRPDVVMCDGQGIAHPRRMGIASHFGLYTGTAAVGCAKSRLTGKFEPPALKKGAYQPLIDKEEIIGYVLCTKDGIKPVYVSPGHLITLEESREITLHCARKYKLPEPTRQAHLLVNQLRQGKVAAGVWQKG